jgi:hypothetical protein
VEVVEGGVLHPLGHGGAGELLEAHHQLALGLAHPAGNLQQQDVPEEVEQVGGEIGTPGLGGLDGLAGVAPVRVRHLADLRPCVGAVDREDGDHLADRLPQLEAGEIPVAAVALADPQEDLGQAVDVARQQLPQDEQLLLPHHPGPVRALSRQFPVEVGQRPFSLRIDEQAAGPVQEVVAGGPLHRPGLAQGLPRLQDLLHHDPGFRGFVAEPLQVLLGIAQAVRMIDAHAVQHPVAQPLEHQGVGVQENPLVLHAQADQGVDVEEAPVVQLLAGGAPEGQPVVLALEQLVELVRIGVDLGDRLVQRPRHLGLLLSEPGELPGEHLLVPMPAGDALAVGGGRERELAQGVGDEGEVGRVAPPGRPRDQGVERARRHRHPVLVVVDLEPAAPARQLQLAVLQDPPVVVAQDGEEHRVAQPLLGRVPVHVEVGGIAARRAVLQHVPPPGVVPLGDGHVVGNDVEHLPEPVLAERAAEPCVALLAPQLLVDPGGIDDVVAVCAPLRRLEVGGAVEMAHPEIGEIAGDRRGLVEAELGAELDTVGRKRCLQHVRVNLQGVDHAAKVGSPSLSRSGPRSRPPRSRRRCIAGGQASGGTVAPSISPWLKLSVGSSNPAAAIGSTRRLRRVVNRIVDLRSAGHMDHLSEGFFGEDELLRSSLLLLQMFPPS